MVSFVALDTRNPAPPLNKTSLFCHIGTTVGLMISLQVSKTRRSDEDGCHDMFLRSLIFLSALLLVSHVLQKYTVHDVNLKWENDFIPFSADLMT